MNDRQELVELDLLIYPVPGFASIRSLGAEILHFVCEPSDFKEIHWFPYVFCYENPYEIGDFLMNPYKMEGSPHKMQYLCAQRSDWGKSRYWVYQEVELYKLLAAIRDKKYKLFFLKHILTKTFSECWMGRLIEILHHITRGLRQRCDHLCVFLVVTPPSPNVLIHLKKKSRVGNRTSYQRLVATATQTARNTSKSAENAKICPRKLLCGVGGNKKSNSPPRNIFQLIS